MAGMAGMTDMPQGAGGGADTDMSNMAMTFFQSFHTPLLFHDARPETAGQYAGACIALALLAVLACALINFKSVLQRTVWMPPKQLDQYLLGDDEKAAAKAYNLATSSTSPAGPRSVGIEVRRWWGSWRSTSLLQRLGMASYEILLATLGYILMLAVMTMNIGYFLSVLAGIWVGTVLLGTVTPLVDNGLQHC
ncbi:Ctr copper transporter family-domain-containing protein [Lasiosphaeris hirsuta]|uniref:Copper transport protein n=1 Tax=Lasiosphaeris hirsuta TaxID=260670 RepID=A0AA39ZPG5_9PEZI|nr:Ctr copper transporter family-domain-containing protein [Lasiosphaeris hirsuta]